MLWLFCSVCGNLSLICFNFPDLQAVKKRRRKENGNSTSSSTASWMWKACQKKEWSLLSCLSRQVLLHGVDVRSDVLFSLYSVIFCEY